jgi:hypothetical protein
MNHEAAQGTKGKILRLRTESSANANTEGGLSAQSAAVEMPEPDGGET